MTFSSFFGSAAGAPPPLAGAAAATATSPLLGAEALLPTSREEVSDVLTLHFRSYQFYHLILDFN